MPCDSMAQKNAQRTPQACLYCLIHADDKNPYSHWPHLQMKCINRRSLKATIFLHMLPQSIQPLLIYSTAPSYVTRYNSETLPGLQLWGGNQMCAGMAMYAKKKGDTRIWGINVQKHRKQKTSNVKCLSWHSPATALEWSHTITSNWILCITAQRPEHYSQG